MTRLVIFLGFLAALFAVLSLDSYKKFPVNTAKFDFNAKYEEHSAKVALIDELQNPVVEEVVEEEVVEVKEVFVLDLDTPELENGAKIYKTCITCHGKDGKGKKAQKAPQLAGQFDWYLYDALAKMKSGERENAIMNPYLRKLTDQDMKDVALYMSKHPWN